MPADVDTSTEEQHEAGPTGSRSDRRMWPWIRRALLVLGVSALAVLVYGVAIEPRLVLAVQREDAEIPGLPPEWDGKEVAVLADLQVGMWLGNVGMARRAVAEVVERRPSTALVLGDFVYGDDDSASNVETAVDVVSPLVDAGIPTFAVLGNHDYTSNVASALEDRLDRAGIPVLRNEAREVSLAGGRPLHVVGIAPALPGEARPDEALDDLPDGAPRVVMMHNPESFDHLPAGTAPFAVAGHTHGGQVRVPFIDWSYLHLKRDEPVHVDGWSDGAGESGNRIFVNRGIGMSIAPVRINCSPAVTFFTLRAA